MKQTGKLTSEQFALAMWLIQQKLNGTDPPAALTPEMVPPTMRPKPSTESNVSLGLCALFLFVLLVFFFVSASPLLLLFGRKGMGVNLGVCFYFYFGCMYLCGLLDYYGKHNEKNLGCFFHISLGLKLRSTYKSLKLSRDKLNSLYVRFS